MRRKPGTLLPLELAILEAATDLARGGGEFHGFGIARELRGRGSTRALTAHGTLYKALDRLQRAELLESRWEDPADAADAGRPRRRLYRVTPLGEHAVAAAAAARPPRRLQAEHSLAAS
jgi:DNA-binding PadR family transcriptional regulator